MKRTARIREVWASNLEEEILKLSRLIDDYEYIAMDTEFPGIVVRLVAHDGPDTNYQTLRGNVDLLKIIQLGLTLSNSNGQSPPDCTTWQFNFAFSLSTDMYAQDSIDLLTNSGIDFAAHERDGIDVLSFGELLTSSGLVINPTIRWVSFHGGYDFAYLVKVLTAIALPESEMDFFDILRIYFPTLYDLKYLMLHADQLFGGLNKVADQLGCERVGTMHQAGSDSLLTMDVFFRMRDNYFDGLIDSTKEGVLFGLGSNAQKTASPSFSPTKLHITATDTTAPNGSSDSDPRPPPTLTAS